MDVKAPKNWDYRIVAYAHKGSDGYIWGKDPMGAEKLHQYILSITSRSVRISKHSLTDICTLEHVYLAHVFQLR